MNIEYTNKWVEDFEEKDVLSYHKKFFNRFEKNIKHRQQIEIIARFLKPELKWLDAPIGSGRITKELKTNHMYGFDRSPAFLAHNKKLGIETIQGDLFDMPFNSEFDVITSLHTLFAFKDSDLIVKQMIKSLKVGGVLIVDLVNKEHINATNPLFGEYEFSHGFTREEAKKMFADFGAELVEIVPYDYYDNRYFLNKKKSKLYARYWQFINKLYFKFDLYSYFDKRSKGREDKAYCKYLFVAKKIK